MLKSVKTNVISGFLGVGKTTAIRQFLSNKPETERWAILINEFGEIGVDGSFFNKETNADGSIIVKEVAGGCMCCTAGLSMQVALTQLLHRAQPDRLLIEPTGLGHPEEVLHTLSSDYNKSVIDLHATLTLVDARSLSDPRYIDHDIFLDQIRCADIIVGTKSDLYTGSDAEQLKSFISAKGRSDAALMFSKQGVLPVSVLDAPNHWKQSTSRATEHSHHIPSVAEKLSNQPMPSSGCVRAENHGSGYESLGFRFDDQFEFDLEKLRVFTTGLSALRFKGVFKTDQGVRAFNAVDGVSSEYLLTESSESRCEVISERIPLNFEKALFDTLSNPKKVNLK